MKKSALFWLNTGLVGWFLLPWYFEADRSHGLLSDWLAGNWRPAVLWVIDGRWWLAPLLLPLAAAGVAIIRGERNFALPKLPDALLLAGALGLLLLLLEGFLIGHRGYTLPGLTAILGPGPRQGGMGLGGLALALTFVALFMHGCAGRGFCQGDTFTATAIGLIVASILLFAFYPVWRVLSRALFADNGSLDLLGFVRDGLDPSIWSLGCIVGEVNCGVAWNTLFLAVLVGVSTTVLGLAFALIAVRTQFVGRPLLRVLSILPVITPPFVIGLAIILLLGRTGAVTSLLADWFGVPRSRWIYGLTGVALAQTLAFTPIAFLVLSGVLQGISPSIEEASQTLRASRWQTFKTVTLPLLRPGLANAFLLGFVESMADFGNPLVLGGSFEVLSTKIFFAVVGSANDPARASILSLTLLSFTLLGFYVQQRWVGRRSYTTVTGKGDAGMHAALPRRVTFVCFAAAVPWAILTVVIYLTIFVGGFVKALGRDYTPTLQHLTSAFSIEQAPWGVHFSGGAWNSFLATLQVSVIAAPITAAFGLMTAYLLTRQTFAGRRAFEFISLLSFAIPGTVIGVGYILAFNVPPVEITGTGLILIICFVFRNMPVGVRSGVATLSQIDKSLDEASLTLGARNWTTLRRVIIPLLRPAIVTSLVYSFVRAMTAVSAVIFLVSAEYNMATAYIVGRVEAGEFGIAIAYSCVLIVVMLFAILCIDWLVGERNLGRRGQTADAFVGA